MKIKTIPIYMIFLAMGLIDSAGPMVSLAKESFKISNTMASLLPMLAYIMYGLLSVPIGLLQDRKGKKFILNMGLAIALSGLIIPIFSGMYGKMVVDSSSMGQFYKILAAILFLGAGGSILQVAGNPIMRDISDEGHYSKNLSFAQSIITIGSSMGFLLPVAMLFAFGLDWSILFPVFSCLVLISFVGLNMIKIKEKRSDDDHHATFKTCFKLLGNRYILTMVIGIFIYCGVEICMSANIPILLSEKFHVKEMGLIISWSLFYLPILAGRFVGSLIMARIAPKRLFLYTVLLTLLGISLIFSNSYPLTLTGILLIGIGCANIFPLIFSITIDYMPEHANELSGLLVSCIAGGALIPPIMGMVADITSIQTAFVVPVVCICYILFVAIINNKTIYEIPR
ncbi:MAG: MFS transporter [Prolixibacteraceae bacterium]|nr:MFS transporter [Prolixibacteraceae bacterium]